MSKKAKPIVVAVLCVIAALVGFRWFTQTQKIEAERISYRRLMDFGLAFHNYASVQRDEVLPAYTLTSDSKPGLSWRVMLLPFVDELELYEKFKLDEAWDSPTNLPLVKEMPQLYRSRLCGKNDEGLTSFVVVTDVNGAFPPVIEKQSLGFNDITDGLSNTLFAVELPEAPEIWTKPDNLTLKEVCEILKKRPSSQPVIMGFLDGSVLQFRSYVGDANLKAFCSRAGNDIVSPKSLGGFFPF